MGKGECCADGGVEAFSEKAPGYVKGLLIIAEALLKCASITAFFLIEQEYMGTSFRVGCQFAKCWLAIFSLFASASKEKSKALSFGSGFSQYVPQ